MTDKEIDKFFDELFAPKHEEANGTDYLIINDMSVVEDYFLEDEYIETYSDIYIDLHFGD